MLSKNLNNASFIRLWSHVFISYGLATIKWWTWNSRSVPPAEVYVSQRYKYSLQDWKYREFFFQWLSIFRELWVIFWKDISVTIFPSLTNSVNLKLPFTSYWGTLRFFICYHLLSVIIDQLKFIYSLKELCFKLSYLIKEKKLCGTGFGKELWKLVLHENHVLELMTPISYDSCQNCAKSPPGLGYPRLVPVWCRQPKSVNWWVAKQEFLAESLTIDTAPVPKKLLENLPE